MPLHPQKVSFVCRALSAAVTTKSLALADCASLVASLWIVVYIPKGVKRHFLSMEASEHLLCSKVASGNLLPSVFWREQRRDVLDCAPCDCSSPCEKE